MYAKIVRVNTYLYEKNHNLSSHPVNSKQETTGSGRGAIFASLLEISKGEIQIYLFREEQF